MRSFVTEALWGGSSRLLLRTAIEATLEALVDEDDGKCSIFGPYK